MIIRTLNKRQLLYILFLIPFVRLEAFNYIGDVSVFYDLSKALVFFLIIFLEMTGYLSTRKAPDRFIFIIVFFFFWSLIASITHNVSVISTLINYITMMSLPLLLDYVFKAHEIKDFLVGARFYFKTLIVLHFILLLIYPDGIYQDTSQRVGFIYDTSTGVHLLGKANATTPILMAMITVIFLSSYVSNTKLSKSDKLCVFLAWLSIVIQFSATGVVGLIVFFILMAFFIGKKRTNGVSKSVNFNFYLILAMLGTVAVCFFNIQYYFSSFLETVLNRDITLSNRTNVWNMARLYIVSNYNIFDYLIGEGLTSYSTLLFNGRYAHSHNQFLDIFIKSGLVGLMLYITLFIISLHVMNRQYKKMQKKEIAIISATVISFVIMFITEVYATPLIMMILYLGYRFVDLTQSRR
mgnify:CR=1 FL=1